jgi:hypothetical protein
MALGAMVSHPLWTVLERPSVKVLWPLLAELSAQEPCLANCLVILPLVQSGARMEKQWSSFILAVWSEIPVTVTPMLQEFAYFQCSLSFRKLKLQEEVPSGLCKVFIFVEVNGYPSYTQLSSLPSRTLANSSWLTQSNCQVSFLWPWPVIQNLTYNWTWANQI